MIRLDPFAIGMDPIKATPPKKRRLKAPRPRRRPAFSGEPAGLRFLGYNGHRDDRDQGFRLDLRPRPGVAFPSFGLPQMRAAVLAFIPRVGFFVSPGRFLSKGAFPMRRILLVGSTWLLLCAPCVAQTLGTITGEVRDSTGLVVPGATVTVVNKSTNATRTTSSNAVGLFDFPAWPPGTYTVKSELEGFKTATRDIELQVQQTARVNFTLELGTLNETTMVTGVSPLVETANATIGTVIENRRIVELPLNGRNYLQFVALSPNVSAE